MRERKVSLQASQMKILIRGGRLTRRTSTDVVFDII